MEERRNYIRYDRNVPAKLLVLDFDSKQDEKNHFLMTKDLCAGGAFLETNQPFQEGSDVVVEIALPVENNVSFDSNNHCFVKMKGSIVRTDATGIALSFNKEFQIEFGELPTYFLDKPIYRNYFHNN